MMDNLFTSPGSLRHLLEKFIAATGTGQIRQMENSSEHNDNEQPITMLPGARATGREHVRLNEANRWIAKGQQSCCAKKGCKGTSVFCCNFRTVGLYHHCFKAYHFE